MKHYSAIKLIQKRILELREQSEKCNKSIGESEMISDLLFANNDAENIQHDIKQLTETMKHLIKQN